MHSQFNRPIGGAPFGSYFESSFSSARSPKTRSEYMDLHKRCPQCGCTDSIAVTTGGFIPPDWSVAQDTNRAHCICGWIGIVHDLKE